MNDDGPLRGIRVLDISTVYAAPITAMLLGDFGADVIKVEHPVGDPARSHGANKDGHGLWWKVISRNKRCVTLKLSTPEGQQILRDLVADADVLVENFRPGVLEKWGLGPEQLHAVNPGLVMLRVTGFGQAGPYAGRRAFGTLAEAMSGFAHQTGHEDGPPTLPPFGLADGVAGITGAFAIITALYHRATPEGKVGWLSRPARPPLPRESCGWSVVPTSSSSPGLPRQVSAAETETCSTRRWPSGSPTARSVR